MTMPEPAPTISLTGPVLFVAFAAATVMSLPVFLGQRAPELFCAQNCCGALTVSLLGVLPVRMFWRQGLLIGPGLGFIVPLLGVFMGGLIGAILQMSVGAPPTAEIRALVDRMFAEYVAELERQGLPTDGASRETWMAAALFVARYGVLLVAAGSAVLAGGVGLVATAIALRIRPPGGPEDDAA